jgi:hypothetical protein
MPTYLIPMAYVSVAVLGGFVLPRIEHIYLKSYLGDVAVGSALAVLGAIASGMMALTAIVFSIAYITVQFNAIAYSPRLALWFANDPKTTNIEGKGNRSAGIVERQDSFDVEFYTGGSEHGKPMRVNTATEAYQVAREWVAPSAGRTFDDPDAKYAEEQLQKAGIEYEKLYSREGSQGQFHMVEFHVAPQDHDRAASIIDEAINL